ncbi:hypothetical protein J2W21_000472 [Sinomonas atrocyanea]|uniref:hypothetical protein n=1 Tax=Sinomonas atrocyanea TaxID=37927 RepID=UPI00278188A3|nr:hypothetical protein [Sinomonas atrocyanea]MDP9882993.1 hypothetical protein [Sinomonas atrocyanea]
MDYRDPRSWRGLLLSGGWGRSARRGNPRGRHVLGIASTVCGALSLAGAVTVSMVLTSELGWYGPRGAPEVGAWLLLQWDSLMVVWLCAGTAVAGLGSGIASLAARWSLGLTVVGLTLSVAALAATINAWGLFFFNHL